MNASTHFKIEAHNKLKETADQVNTANIVAVLLKPLTPKTKKEPLRTRPTTILLLAYQEKFNRDDFCTPPTSFNKFLRTANIVTTGLQFSKQVFENSAGRQVKWLFAVD